ncbi:hypothetical protein ACOBV9_20080 (plasmid) [Pseudoalteromonas espejiana]
MGRYTAKPNNPEQVLNTLSQFSSLQSQLEDAVLLRLAIAEKRSSHKGNKQWQTRMQQRVNSRENDKIPSCQ